MSFPLPCHAGDDSPRRSQRQDAAIARGSVAFRDMLQEPQQLAVIRLIIAVPACKPRRRDARGAAERVDLDAGVIGQRKEAGRLRNRLGLLDGVGLEGAARFSNLGRVRKLGERMPPDAGHAQEPAELAGLMRIACGDDHVDHETGVYPGIRGGRGGRGAGG